MFLTLDKIAKADPKYEDIMLLENYASFQNRYCSSVTFRALLHILFCQMSLSADGKQLCSLYDLANMVPTLAKFYHEASESYEQACTRLINMIIFYVSFPISYFVMVSLLLLLLLVLFKVQVFLMIYLKTCTSDSNLSDFFSLFEESRI